MAIADPEPRLAIAFAAGRCCRAACAGCAISAPSGGCRPRRSKPIERDVRQFLLSSPSISAAAPGLNELAATQPQDVRAFMASRRSDGIGSRSLMRALAGVRSFARFLERNGKGKVGALAAVRAPKMREDAAEAARRDVRRKQHHRHRPARRRGARAMGSGARRRGAGAALRLGLAHFRGASACKRGDVPAPGRATPSPSPARATSSAWCRCCRRWRS